LNVYRDNRSVLRKKAATSLDGFNAFGGFIFTKTVYDWFINDLHQAIDSVQPKEYSECDGFLF